MNWVVFFGIITRLGAAGSRWMHGLEPIRKRKGQKKKGGEKRKREEGKMREQAREVEERLDCKWQHVTGSAMGAEGK